MSFEVYQPKHSSFGNSLRDGECSIHRNGTVLVQREELDLVGIGDKVTVLVDGATMRIAFRKPRPDEEDSAIRLKHMKNKHGAPGSRCHINIAGAICAMQLEPEAVAGRYEPTTKEDLLIINLTDGNKGAASRSA